MCEGLHVPEEGVRSEECRVGVRPGSSVRSGSARSGWQVPGSANQHQLQLEGNVWDKSPSPKYPCRQPHGKRTEGRRRRPRLRHQRLRGSVVLPSLPRTCEAEALTRERWAQGRVELGGKAVASTTVEGECGLDSVPDLARQPWQRSVFACDVPGRAEVNGMAGRRKGTGDGGPRGCL